MLALALTACTDGSDAPSEEIGQDELAIDTSTQNVGGRISAGNDFSCMIRSNGEVACWGDFSHRGVAFPPHTWPPPQSPPPPGRFRQIASGKHHTCGLRVDGTAECWGANNNGHVTEAPTGVFRHVHAAGSAACAITMDGRPHCWGWGFTSSESGKTTVGAGWPWDAGDFTSIAAPADHDNVACAVRRDGTVQCSFPTYRDTGVEPAPKERFAQVAMGDRVACGVLVGGALRCWGHMYGGRLKSPPYGTFTQVSMGKNTGLELVRSHACAVKTDGSIACWGENDSGKATPPSTGEFVEVAAGQRHTCALRKDGGVVCWGAGPAASAPSGL